MPTIQPTLETGTVTILGKRGAGKTTLANAIARLRPNVLCIDPLNDAGFGTPITWETIGEMARGGHRQISFPMSIEQDKDERVAKVFRWALVAAFRDALPKPFTLHIDEVDLFGSAWLNDPNLKKLANYGRHRDFSFIVNARRYSAIPKDWTTQSDMIVMGPSVDRLADGRVIDGILGRANRRRWERLTTYQFMANTLDGAGYIRYDEYSGHIGYTGLPVGDHSLGESDGDGQEGSDIRGKRDRRDDRGTGAIRFGG